MLLFVQRILMRLHCRGRFFMGKVNATLATVDQCNRLQCSSFQDVNWHSALYGPCLIAEPLVCFVVILFIVYHMESETSYWKC